MWSESVTAHHNQSVTYICLNVARSYLIDLNVNMLFNRQPVEIVQQWSYMAVFRLFVFLYSKSLLWTMGLLNKFVVAKGTQANSKTTTVTYFHVASEQIHKKNRISPTVKLSSFCAAARLYIA